MELEKLEPTPPIFGQCPLACTGKLEPTDIRLSEGNLLRCPGCNQLLSACTTARFQQSMQEFNAPEGTLPSGRNASRYEKRMGNILKSVARRSRLAPQKLRLLDVGCSSGALLEVASKLGFPVSGVEPAEQAAATASSRGFDVFPGLLQEANYPADNFDIVTMFEVVEHLIDPISVGREIYRILNPGGLLIIGTGNANSWTVRFLGSKWEYFDIGSHGGHISFFNPESVGKLAVQSGFRLATVQTKRVNLAERKDVSPAVYKIAKVIREVLALPARWLGKGHDMLAILEKPK